MTNPFQKYIINIVISLVAGIVGAGLVLNGVIPTKYTQGVLSPTTSTISQNSAGAAAASQDALVEAVVDKTSPAVVSIIISQDIPVIQQFGFPNSQVDPFGSWPFGPFGMMPQQQLPQPTPGGGTQKQEIGGGSGFIVSTDGMIVTNKHVVDQTNAEYTVVLNNGAKYTAKVVARDPVNDIAVIKIDANNLPFLSFGDSNNLKVGQTAVAIGNALSEFHNTVSVGVISGLARSITAGDMSGQSEQLSQVIQTDAAINPGNSGGPLLNLNGQVVGINVAVAQGSQNIGFALPANQVKNVVEMVLTQGKIVHPFLGVRYMPVTTALKDQNHLSMDYGVIVSRGQDATQLAVIPGSPANKAGIVEGDIILEVDGKKLDSNTSLASVVSEKKVGDDLTLKISHQGAEKTVTVKLAEMPAP